MDPCNHDMFFFYVENPSEAPNRFVHMQLSNTC